MGDPDPSVSEGVVNGVYVNGVSKTSSYYKFAVESPNAIEGIEIEVGGNAFSTGSTTYADGTGVKGYASSQGSEKLDIEAGEFTLEVLAFFRGSNNMFGTKFTGDASSEGYITYDGTGKVTKTGGSAQSDGETIIAGFFSSTGRGFAEGSIEVYSNGTTLLEGEASF